MYHRSVTQPKEADDTFLMYLYSVPRVLLYGGAVHASLLFRSSSSLTCMFICFELASMDMTSPSCTCISKQLGLVNHNSGHSVVNPRFSGSTHQPRFCGRSSKARFNEFVVSQWHQHVYLCLLFEAWSCGNDVAFQTYAVYAYRPTCDQSLK